MRGPCQTADVRQLGRQRQVGTGATLRNSPNHRSVANRVVTSPVPRGRSQIDCEDDPVTSAEETQSGLEVPLREIELHVAADGWDQPVRLFALVDTQELLEQQPELRATIGSGSDVPLLTSVEQDDLPKHDDLTDLLAQLSWPPSVEGVAVVAERIVLPTDRDIELPSDPDQARSMAIADPHAHDLRVAAAATRAGERFCLLRLREYDDEKTLVAGPDLMIGLTELIHASLTT